MPVAIVHTVLDLRSVLEEARQAGRGVRIQSPPGAAGVQGIGWWQAMLDIAFREFPDVLLSSRLDCGASPGLALEALRAGIAEVQVEAPPDVLERLQDIALRMKARVDCERAFAFDPQGESDSRKTCRDGITLPGHRGGTAPGL